jgi:anti-sigma factor (TIGR02949 family)
MPRPADAASHRVGPGLGCAEVLDRLEEYVDDELDAATRAAVRAHLAVCPACSDEADLAQRVQGELRALGELDAPGSVLGSIRSSVAAEPGAPVRRRWLLPARPWLAAAAAVLVGIALGLALAPGLRPSAPAQVAETTGGPEPTGTAAPGPDVPTAAEVAEARSQARLALAMVATVGRRAGEELQRDVVVRQLLRPAVESLERWRDPIDPAGSRTSGRPGQAPGPDRVPVG